ncbi:MAG: ABC transporter ATP-binding protein [Syntrophaceae bacterium]|nr:ABC transporter ATP-binding protein [Syntrophaceae bacterium]
MSPENLIEIRGVTKTYPSKRGNVDALGRVDMSVARGEFVSIVGPSGCGKSTLLKIVAGLLPQTTGEVLIGGKEVDRPQSNIGIVFQSPVLMEWRTVIKNILIQAEVRRMEMEGASNRARRLLQLVGLEGFENHRPYELSGGMQQRVAICRALIHDPPLLLMDEPFGALDNLTREQLTLDFQHIWMETKKTVFFVTHNILEAVFLSDRVVGMTPRPGRIDLIEEIDIPRPRTWDLLGSERFGHYVEVLRTMFRSQGVLCDARNLSGLRGPNECRTTSSPSSLPSEGEG